MKIISLVKPLILKVVGLNNLPTSNPLSENPLNVNLINRAFGYCPWQKLTDDCLGPALPIWLICHADAMIQKLLTDVIEINLRPAPVGLLSGRMKSDSNVCNTGSDVLGFRKALFSVPPTKMEAAVEY